MTQALPTHTSLSYATLTEDLLMGKNNEKKLLEYLNNLPENKDSQFEVFKNKFETFDFINDNGVIAELKSRRVSHNRYKDTMIGNNKMKVCKEKHKDHVKGAEYRFYFLFTDGLYTWKYGDSDYEVRKFFHKDKQSYKDYAYIPISALKLVSTEITS